MSDQHDGSVRGSIRRIQPTDAEILATLHIRSWRSAYRGILRDAYLDADLVDDRHAVWREQTGNLTPCHFGFIAEIGTQPVGFVFLHGQDDPTWGTLIDNLHVLPDFKGNGLGRLLMAAAAQEASARYPDDGMYLWVFEENTQARGFYAHLGGRSVERALVEAPGGGQVPRWRVAWSNPGQLVRAASYA
jgi:ribosomal protein S18 acetylase RimI-like enzyme